MPKQNRHGRIALNLSIYIARYHLRERFFAHVDMPAQPTDCWLWTGARNENGYGRFQLGGRGSPVACTHRVAFELLRGQAPLDRDLDHLCDVRHCINPWHLKPETSERNRSYRHRRFSTRRYRDRPAA